MAEGLIQNERATLAGSALLVSILIGLSRVTGIAREIMRTTLFGRDWHTDAYVSAFSIPDLIYFLASGGALSAGFVPIFSGYLVNGQDEKALKTFRVLMTQLGLLSMAIVVVFELLAPQLVLLFFPGMVGNEKKFNLTVQLVRIILPAQFFFALGSLFTGALFSLRYFAEPQIQSILYNLCIMVGGIIGVYTGSHLLGMGIEGMAVGALVGATIGAGLVQARKLRKIGMKFRLCFDFSDEGAKQVIKLTIPVVLSLSVTQINAIILPRSFSSLLPHGAATAVETANRIMQLPVALFGTSIGIALFPIISALATKEELGDLRRQISSGMRMVLILTVPSVVLMAVLGEPVISLLFQYGRWTEVDTKATALVLLFYGFGVPAMACQQVLGRGFYALRDTRTPLWVGLISFGLAFALNCVLVHSPLQQGGLALAFSVSAWVSTVLLAWLLSRPLKGLEGATLWQLCKVVIPAATLMGLFTWTSLSIVPSGEFTLRLLRVVFPALVGIFVYIVMVARSNLPEARQLIAQIEYLLTRLTRWCRK